MVVLLLTDILWGTWVAWKINSSVWSWVIVNVCTLPFLAVVFYAGAKSKANFTAGVGMSILFVRMLVDYSASMPFYFPVESTTAAVAPGGNTVSKPVVHIA